MLEFFTDTLRRMLDRSEDEPISLLTLHIDGDLETRVLRRLAESIAEPLRRVDVLARVSEHQLAIIVPGVHEDTAMKLAEEIRDTAQRTEVGLSVGVASRRPTDGVESLLARAAASHRRRDGVGP